MTADSRKVKPGYAFVAFCGTQFDGHKYVGEAVRKGATVVYAEKDPGPIGIPVNLVPSGRVAFAQLAAAFHGQPASRLRCIGCTGTNGKTTTTALIQWIFNRRSRQAGLIGSVSIDSGEKIKDSRLTTPGPEEIQKGLASMVENGLTHAVLEVSSHGLEQARVHGITFAVTIFTNISADHLNYHPSLSDYVRAKTRLFAQTAPDGAAVLFRDDPHWQAMKKACPAPTYTYSLSGTPTPFNKPMTSNSKDVDLLATQIETSQDGVRLKAALSSRLRQAHAAAARRKGLPYVDPGPSLKFCARLFGRHNAANCLAAALATMLEGTPTEQIIEGIETFQPVWRRQQPLSYDGPLVIDDTCHNPSSYQALFETIDTLPKRRTLMVNGIRGSRGTEVNQLNGQVFAQWARHQTDLRLWVTDCKEVAAEADRVTLKERAAFLDELDRAGIDYAHHPDLRPCISEMVDEISEGDIGLLVGSLSMNEAAAIFLEIWQKRHAVSQTQNPCYTLFKMGGGVLERPRDEKRRS